MQHDTLVGRSGKHNGGELDMSWTRQTGSICASSMSARRVSVSIFAWLSLYGRKSATTRVGCSIVSQKAVLTVIRGGWDAL
jgi:hypothetical protein